MTTTDMSYDDQHDDYDDIDDEYPDQDAQVGYVGDAETLLRRAIDIVSTAPTMPLSSSPRIDRDEIIELLEESLHRLPDELRQARWTPTRVASSTRPRTSSTSAWEASKSCSTSCRRP